MVRSPTCSRGADILITSSPSRACRAWRPIPPRCTSASRSSWSSSITPYGLEGPYADRPATELTLQAESGALAVRGHPSREPVQAGGRTMEWVSGLYAAVAALAASRVVRRGGPGELVDLSIAEVANTTGTTAADLMDSLRGRPNPGAPGRSFETPSIEPTVRRLRRVQHEHPHAVRQLPPDDRTARPDRGRRTGPSIAHRVELGGVERDHPRLDAEAHDRRGGRRWRPSCASRSRRSATAPRSSSSSRPSARGSLVDDPDRRRSACPRRSVADRRRGLAAAAGRRRASASTPARSSPRPPEAPATAPSARCRCTGVQGPRPHRLVGGPVGDRRCSPRSAPTSSTSSRSPGPTACAWPAA